MLATLLYADDGIVASPESAHLQGAFNVLTVLFDHVGLCINEGKTVIMACRTCHPPHVWSKEAYTWLVTRQGLSYRERLHNS